MQARVATKAQAAAESAQREAESARDEALKLSREATNAAKRLADAQEAANLIELGKRPVPHVSWQVRRSTGRDVRLLVNTGNIAALKVRSTAVSRTWVDEDSNSERVEPGDSVEFAVLMATFGSGRAKLRVAWIDDGSGVARSWERFVD